MAEATTFRSILTELVDGVTDAGPPSTAPHRHLNIFRFSELSLDGEPNLQYIDLVPSRYEGRFAIVIDAGWDAVDA